MGWFFSRKRNAKWKQESMGQSMTTVSPSPTLHLLVIFGIVISLLWLSHYYKAQPHHHTPFYFHLFLLLSPILLILFFISYSTCGRLSFPFTRSEHDSLQRAMVSPWNFSILLLLLLLLLSISYQSSFHSKWFGPLY